MGYSSIEILERQHTSAASKSNSVNYQRRKINLPIQTARSNLHIHLIPTSLLLFSNNLEPMAGGSMRSALVTLFIFAIVLSPISTPEAARFVFLGNSHHLYYFISLHLFVFTKMEIRTQTANLSTSAYVYKMLILYLVCFSDTTPICPACVCCAPAPQGSCCDCCATPIETQSQEGSP